MGATISFCDFQLLHNEVNTESIADEWRPIIKECTSVCLRADLHKDCNICSVLDIQLKHCASCHVDICSVCSRIVALISMHYTECRQLQQQGCRCAEYLPASWNPDLDLYRENGMVPRDRVRAYLQSVCPASDHVDGEDKYENNSGSEDDDDDSSDEDDKDYDSDSSEDSIMMPSFSLDLLQKPANRDDDIPGLNEPEDNAHWIAHSLSGRGVNSAGAVPVERVSHTAQRTKPSAQLVGGAVAAAGTDPRICMSFQASASSRGLHDGVIHSVPVTGRLRPRGRVHYGTKMELRRFASLWQVRTERARRDGICNLGDLPVQGIILRDFRHVSCFH